MAKNFHDALSPCCIAKRFVRTPCRQTDPDPGSDAASEKFEVM
jgi:hypothetical protein